MRKPESVSQINKKAFSYLTNYAIQQKQEKAFVFIADLILRKRKLLVSDGHTTNLLLEYLIPLVENSQAVVISSKEKIALFQTFYSVVSKQLDRYIKGKDEQKIKQIASLRLHDRLAKLVYITDSADLYAHVNLLKFIGKTVKAAVENYKDMSEGIDKDVFREHLFSFANLCVKHELPSTMKEIPLSEKYMDLSNKLSIELYSLFPLMPAQAKENLLSVMLQ